MSDLDRQPKPDSDDNEIESPVDGPMPNWMRAATSTSKSSFEEDKAPDWLRAIRAGKNVPVEDEPLPATGPSSAEEDYSDDDGMSDLERLLAEEGIDLNTVAEERPAGSEGMSAKDWLISTSDDDLVRRRLDHEPPAQPPPSPPSPPAPAQTMDTMSDLERLLAEEGIDLNTVAEERPAGSEGMSAKDWLISTSEDDLVRKRLLGDEPPVEEPEPPMVEDDKMVVSEDLPDWLQEEVLAGFEGGLRASVSPGYEVEGENDKMVVADDLPDWLREVEDSVPAPAEPGSSVTEPEPLADDKMVVAGDLPDWLREEEEVETPAEDDKLVVTADLPDWLQEPSDQEMITEETGYEATPAGHVQPPAEETLPDWLQDFQEEGETGLESVLAAGSPAAETEDLPDWLRDIEDGSVEEPEVTPAAPLETTPARAELVDEEELPDWLREVELDETGEEVTLPAETADDEDVPDWLKKVQAEQDEALDLTTAPILAEPSSISSLPASSADTGVSEDLPDWLQEVELEEQEPAYGDMASLLSEAPIAEPKTIEESELPDWLQEVERAETEDLFEPSEPSPDPFADVLISEDEMVAGEELPDWLQEARSETAQAGEVVTPAEEVAATTGEEELVDQTGLPDWLREVEEETEPLALEEEILPVEPSPPLPVEAEPTEPVSPLPEVETPPIKPVTSPESEVTTQLSGLPDWLKKLRQGGEEVAPQVSPPAPVPVAANMTRVISQQAAPRPEATQLAAPPPMPVPQPEPAPADLPADTGERLKLARVARDEGDIDKALRIYESLVASGSYLDSVIDDVQQATKSYPSNYLLYQVMGDAMLREGRLQSALEAYRTALAKL